MGKKIIKVPREIYKYIYNSEKQKSLSRMTSDAEAKEKKQNLRTRSWQRAQWKQPTGCGHSGHSKTEQNAAKDSNESTKESQTFSKHKNSSSISQKRNGNKNKILLVTSVLEQQLSVLQIYLHKNSHERPFISAP